MDPQLAGARMSHIDVLENQDLGSAVFVDSHDSAHAGSLHQMPVFCSFEGVKK
jgi:hypothetical protein